MLGAIPVFCLICSAIVVVTLLEQHSLEKRKRMDEERERAERRAHEEITQLFLSRENKQ